MSNDLKLDQSQLLDQTQEIITSDQNREDKLQAICELLDREIEIFNWTGFYMVDPDADRELVLGPYVGEATDHTRIPFGRGICGQAAETKETFVVQDVSKADNYLSCSIHVKSEIVVPIMKGDEVIGELDIDSHTKDAITGDHRELLEQVCDQVSTLY
jgi:L-methionine (R)-S-oxide reductase